MAKFKKRVHLICNAHIDPIWLWEIEEGKAETLSTFRTAAEFCENSDTFIFNHNEVLLYEWIREFEPNLFRRIQKLVKLGKWHIMGGWYLQPDCNMPSGESFVRHILTGRQYFKKHFGKAPTTAINFDPFGHTQGLVQILAKSGYDSYLYMRPHDKFMELPDDNFIWKGYDGSEILVHRFGFAYGTAPGKACEKIEKYIEDNQDKNVSAVLWGVGNHGGGPSRYDLGQIEKLRKKNTGFEIIHSTPEAYFKALRKSLPKHPVVNRDLNPWGPGCYTSIVEIKQKHRELENSLYMAEKMSAAAMVNGLMEYPLRELAEAQKDMMLGEFHDILPGSSVEPGRCRVSGFLSMDWRLPRELKRKRFSH